MKVDLPLRLLGLTLDGVYDADNDTGQPDETTKRICQRLDDISGRKTVKPIVRTVFDFNDEAFQQKRYRYDRNDFMAEAQGYRKALELISQHAYIMGEIVDSSDVYRCHYGGAPTSVYLDRTKAYFAVLHDLVDVWEVGNEINGEWVGWKDSAWEDPTISIEQMAAMRRRVKDEISSAFAFLKEQHARIAITYYFNDDYANRHSWTDDLKRSESTGELQQFGHNYALPEWARQGQRLFPNANYILLSYYQDDNYSGAGANRMPIIPDYDQWASIFKNLHNLYPNASFGFGEVGPQCYYLREDTECLLHEPNEKWKKTRNKKKCDRQCDCSIKAQTAYVRQYYIDWHEGIRAKLGTLGIEDRYVGGYFYWYFKNDFVDYENQVGLKILQEAYHRYYPGG